MTTDTTSVVRLYLVSIAVASLVALWLLLARTPFPGSTPGTVDADTAKPSTIKGTVDPRIVALDRRERALRTRARKVGARRDARWARYRSDLRDRQQINATTASDAAAAARLPALPSISIAGEASPPPTTSTRSS